jgi:hypothetical protein
MGMDATETEMVCTGQAIEPIPYILPVGEIFAV